MDEIDSGRLSEILYGGSGNVEKPKTFKDQLNKQVEALYDKFGITEMIQGQQEQRIESLIDSTKADQKATIRYGENNNIRQIYNDVDGLSYAETYEGTTHLLTSEAYKKDSPRLRKYSKYQASHPENDISYSNWIKEQDRGIGSKIGKFFYTAENKANNVLQNRLDEVSGGFHIAQNPEDYMNSDSSTGKMPNISKENQSAIINDVEKEPSKIKKGLSKIENRINNVLQGHLDEASNNLHIAKNSNSYNNISDSSTGEIEDKIKERWNNGNKKESKEELRQRLAKENSFLDKNGELNFKDIREFAKNEDGFANNGLVNDITDAIESKNIEKANELIPKLKKEFSAFKKDNSKKKKLWEKLNKESGSKENFDWEAFNDLEEKLDTTFYTTNRTEKFIEAIGSQDGIELKTSLFSNAKRKASEIKNNISSKFKTSDKNTTEAEKAKAEKAKAEKAKAEKAKAEKAKAEKAKAEKAKAEKAKAENNQGENNQGENNQGENNQGENNQGENNQGENNQGENGKPKVKSLQERKEEIKDKGKKEGWTEEQTNARIKKEELDDAYTQIYEKYAPKRGKKKKKTKGGKFSVGQDGKDDPANALMSDYDKAVEAKRKAVEAKDEKAYTEASKKMHEIAGSYSEKTGHDFLPDRQYWKRGKVSRYGGNTSKDLASFAARNPNSIEANIINNINNGNGLENLENLAGGYQDTIENLKRYGFNTNKIKKAATSYMELSEAAAKNGLSTQVYETIQKGGKTEAYSVIDALKQKQTALGDKKGNILGQDPGKMQKLPKGELDNLDAIDKEQKELKTSISNAEKLFNKRFKGGIKGYEELKEAKRIHDRGIAEISDDLPIEKPTKTDIKEKGKYRDCAGFRKRMNEKLGYSRGGKGSWGKVGTAVVATSLVAGTLAMMMGSNKGEQSNAQLYGQQPIY